MGLTARFFPWHFTCCNAIIPHEFIVSSDIAYGVHSNAQFPSHKNGWIWTNVRMATMIHISSHLVVSPGGIIVVASSSLFKCYSGGNFFISFVLLLLSCKLGGVVNFCCLIFTNVHTTGNVCCSKNTPPFFSCVPYFDGRL